MSLPVSASTKLGFDYIVFDDTHFREDLQWVDAVPMFERLIALCAERGPEFGVKLTNTFPVDVTNELPSTEMYMSGRSLFSLTIEAARRITEQFDGKTAHQLLRWRHGLQHPRPV